MPRIAYYYSVSLSEILYCMSTVLPPEFKPRNTFITRLCITVYISLARRPGLSNSKQVTQNQGFIRRNLDPARLHGTGRIWDRSEIRPLSSVYTRIRPVRGSQIRPVPWFSCVYTAETDEFQPGSKFVRPCKRGLTVNL
jgi:hypothetical protein